MCTYPPCQTSRILFFAALLLAATTLVASSAYADLYQWTARSSSNYTDDWKGAAASANGQYLAAARYGGGVSVSNNSGTSWIIGEGTVGIKVTDVDVSPAGDAMIAASEDSYVYVSSNYGNNWYMSGAAELGGPDIGAVAVGGGCFVAAVNGHDIYYSSNGTNWTSSGGSYNNLWTGAAISHDGQRAYVVSGGDYVFLLQGCGASLTPLYSSPALSWVDVDTSAGGQHVVGVAPGEAVRLSTDYGASWQTLAASGSRQWTSVSISGNGQRIVASVDSGAIYVSADGGLTWYEETAPGARLWREVSISSDGYLIVAASSDSYVYTSLADSGTPTVSSVSALSADGAYAAGSVISVTVNFSKNVVVTGSPRILLETGSTDRYANYASGSGTSSIVFSYTVQAGDSNADLDYVGSHVTSHPLQVNGGTIRDLFGTDANVTLPAAGAAGSLGANKAIVIDAAAPTVSLSAPTNGSAVSGTVTVSASASDATLVGVAFRRGTNTAIGAEDTSSPYSVSWDTTALADGPQTLVAVARDAAGNYATSSAVSVTVDNAAPTVLSASSSKASDTYGVGEVIDVDVQFSEAVTSTGNVTVTLETGATDRTCSFSVSASTFGTCSYTVQAGDESADLNVASIAGVVRDAAGNLASSLTPASNLAANEAIAIDAVAPTVSVSSPVDGATVSATVSLEASASDANLEGVRFYVDGVAEGAEDTSSPYAASWDAAALAAGDYSIVAVARDALGNYATSSAVSVTVDNGGPTPDPEPEPEPESPSRRSSSGRAQALGRVFSRLAGEDDQPAGTFTENLTVGDSGDEVRRLQVFLNANGFPVATSGPGSAGQETNLFGEATRQALAEFQAAQGITGEGDLDQATRQAIEDYHREADAADSSFFGRDLSQGSRGLDVAALQRLLIRRLVGPAADSLALVGPTGFFGPLTRAALGEFQASLGVSPASGFFGAITRAALGL